MIDPVYAHELEAITERILRETDSLDTLFVEVPLDVPFWKGKPFAFLMLGAFLAGSWFLSQRDLSISFWFFFVTGSFVHGNLVLGALLQETVWKINCFRSCKDLSPRFVLYSAKVGGHGVHYVPHTNRLSELVRVKGGVHPARVVEAFNKVLDDKLVSGPKDIL